MIMGGMSRRTGREKRERQAVSRSKSSKHRGWIQGGTARSSLPECCVYSFALTMRSRKAGKRVTECGGRGEEVQVSASWSLKQNKPNAGIEPATFGSQFT